ncbi:DUF4377 domain-containing protein [Antarcticibacterium sp. 1MA-6-2]|uniref:DUF4377 domain-containing protein n=1 Tax=Antarcticibacterium sp. 1MA-6-2 TaxID=2908210 RepID=UPI001F3E84F8|nr:DUF4377 domain-containing protein [Antarcticibacterium sp. 1MA-6-2]UJH91031.1 DUF4377 domain-containing protein [Antarcticibacterium sp. 1MA-6-2]
MKILVLLVLVLTAGCSATADVGEEIKMRVNSSTVNCEGLMEGECLLIQQGEKIDSEDWEYFYFKDDIVGFNYEPGFIYDIIVKRIPVANPPQDVSSFKYELVKILSKARDEQ